MNGWAKIKEASRYAGVSERTLRTWLKEGLKHSRLRSGTILVQYTCIDEFIEQFADSQNNVDKIVDQVLKESNL